MSPWAGSGLGIASTCEIVLQPLGAFIVDRATGNFNTVNPDSLEILRYFGTRAPEKTDPLPERADLKGLPRAKEIVRSMVKRGYLVRGGSGSFPDTTPEASILKATRADLEITNRCNLHCCYCFVEANKHKGELSTPEWIEMLDGMIAHGLKVLLVTGGEPFLHKGALTIIEWAVTHGLIVDVNTNGAYVTPEVARRLAKAKVRLVQISLDSVEPAHHDSLRGRGSHAKAMAAIHSLHNEGVMVRLATVLTGMNREQLPGLQRLAEELEVEFEVSPITRTGYARDIPEAVWQENFALSDAERLESEDSESVLGFQGTCQSSVGAVSVSADGTLKPCGMAVDFFRPAGSLLLAEKSTRWWDRYYEVVRLEILSSTVLDRPTRNLRIAEADGYICQLQRLALGSTAGVPRGLPGPLACE